MELLGPKLFKLLKIEDEEQQKKVFEFLTQGIVLANFTHMKQDKLGKKIMNGLEEIKQKLLDKVDELDIHEFTGIGDILF